MEKISQVLVNVTAVCLDNGIPFHAKTIGLPHFRVPVEQALREGFILEADSSVN